tara:strand:- start:8509 stop:8736 length:228 start_codon:yes stop_codon:yes gene_type:complete
MRLTKDEARILSAALEIAKYEFNTLSLGVFDKLCDLENRLEEFGKDQRRAGRTSQNDLSDCMRRFANSKKCLTNN